MYYLFSFLSAINWISFLNLLNAIIFLIIAIYNTYLYAKEKSYYNKKIILINKQLCDFYKARYMVLMYENYIHMIYKKELLAEILFSITFTALYLHMM